MTEGIRTASGGVQARGRHKKKSGLARSSLLMAAGTMASRATGLIRQVLQGVALGTGLLASTYNTANTVPTSLYTLLIGGALNAVLVPQLVRARMRDADGGLAYEQRLVTLVLVVLGIGSLAAVLAAPQIVSVYLPDTPDQHEAYQLTVTFARYLLPQIFFYGLYAIYGQVLNARERFGAMMWTPVLNNFVLIAMFGGYLTLLTVPSEVAGVTALHVRWLGIGTTGALALQALALIPFARAAGFRFRPRFDWRGTGLGPSLAAARWTLLFVLANLTAMTVVTHYANLVDTQAPDAGAGYSAYSYAQTIWILPQSLVTVSVVTALLPRLSRAAAAGELRQLRGDLARALRMTNAFIVPAAFLFAALGPEIAVLLFQHGAVKTTVPLGQMLQVLGPGLIPFSMQFVLLRGFYAFEDTRTPFFMAALIAGVNIVLAYACHVLLPVKSAVVGMAAAYGVSYLVGLVVTMKLLRKKTRRRLGGKLVSAHLRLFLASGVAAIAAAAVVRVAERPGTVGLALTLVAALLVAGVVYLLLARVLGIRELDRFTRRKAA
ncbi:murein biosynthesis integral membrane protein MurJ [Streptomyces sp. SPB074]|uniref:murein biosynthesis integral membrane protein MurJ n=1 Tax=Streptomyces sp. (strain SPB074) TaxID=465543 RepID=UPI00055E099E|nr:murein biosynthesis integral membrane protein MurJ [Streptomyces sp. SPB074]